MKGAGTPRRGSSAWRAALIRSLLAVAVSIGTVPGPLPAHDKDPSGPDAASDGCASRQAIATRIAALEAARATGTPFDEVVAQSTEIEQNILKLEPDAARACPPDVSLLRLTERFDPLRHEITSERRRRQIGAKSWPEHVKVAVLEDRVEIGMTREQVTAAWGEPRRVDLTAITRQEQWTYSGPTYLYFANGALVMIARPRLTHD